MARHFAVLCLLAWTALLHAQDMPLSQVLIEGEGWLPSAEPPPFRGAAAAAIPSHPTGRKLAIRDVVKTRSGRFYVTVPSEPAIYLVGSDGKRRVVDDTIPAPTGATLSPDEGTLVVGDASSKVLWALRIDADGSLSGKEGYYAVWTRRGEKMAGTAALTTDTGGRLYAATSAGVQIFDPTGRLCGVLLKPSPGPVTAVWFSGPKRNMLRIVCDGKVYARKTQAKGIAPE